MQIDLTRLNIDNELLIEDNVIFNENIYGTSGIKKLDNIKLIGKIYYNSVDELILEGHLRGLMILEDTLTLDDIELPLDIEINEILNENKENLKNGLEIQAVLWQNIVLEVPIRITKGKSIPLKGSGWELKDEKESNYGSSI